MSLINRVKLQEKLVEVEYEDIPGFFVTLAYLSREKLNDLRNKCVTMKKNNKTRQMEEVVDQDKFLTEYSKSVIRGWRGLYIRNLPSLIIADISGLNPDEEIPFNNEEALDLLKESTNFDTFVTETLRDTENFIEQQKVEEEKN